MLSINGILVISDYRCQVLYFPCCFDNLHTDGVDVSNAFNTAAKLLPSLMKGKFHEAKIVGLEECFDRNKD